MKIKSLGYLSFLLSFNNVDILTDPFLLNDVGLKLSKTKADVVLYTNSKGVVDVGKIEPSKKESVLNIQTSGEFELGGVMIRRNISNSYYILDEDLLRIVYVGQIGKGVKIDDFKNLGDVEVLIMPVGDGKNFPEFSVIEKIINEVEPLTLIPSGFRTQEMSSGEDLGTVDEFVKQAGYTNVREEKVVNISGSVEKEVRNMEVIILK